jgi:hypothetical protein
MTKRKTFLFQICIAASVLILVQLACLSPSRLIPDPNEPDLTGDKIRMCLAEKADLGFKVQDPEWKTSSSGKKISCSTKITIIAPEEYSVMIKKYIVSSSGGEESSQWTKTWELFSAGTSSDLGEIYNFEHQKEDGTYTEYRYIEKIIPIKVEPGCEGVAQDISEYEYISVDSDLIWIPNPCR